MLKRQQVGAGDLIGCWGRPPRCERQGRIGVRTESIGRRRRQPGWPAQPASSRWSRRPARHLGRRLQRRLHGARDLRRRRQRDPGEDVKIGGVKVGTVGSVTPTPQAKAAVVLNIENPGFQDFRADASCDDPPAGADRREVRRLPAHAAARGRHAAAAAAEQDPQRPGRRRRVPAARPEHQQPRRRRPARRHRPPARTRAPDDHPQRTRRRPRRPRQRPQRSHQARQPGAAGTRQGARRSWPARTTSWPNSRSTPTRRSRRFARVREQVADFLVQSNRSPRRPPPSAARWRRTSKLPAFLRQLGPAMERLARFAEQTTPVFTDLKTGRARPQRGLHAPAGLLEQLDQVLRKPRHRPPRQSGPALVARQTAAQAA